MDIKVGTIVCSRAGRDKGRFFAVLELNEKYAEIADGDLRKTAKPKRKSLRHLAATNHVLPYVQRLDDKALYNGIYGSVNCQKED